MAGLVIGLVGCGPPTDNVVVDQNGTSIRISDIEPIATSDTLTTDQKREALRQLGLSDALIDVILTVMGGA